MKRVYNFSAGPAMLPETVLRQAADEMLCKGSSGMSVMEMSHRSKDFDTIIKEAESDLRDLMSIPDNYKIIFMQGGASSQFACVPLNLASSSDIADYVITGQWAKKAAKEAERFCTVNRVASSDDKTFTYIPDLDPSKFTKDAAYFHITTNNTIYGTRFTTLPDTGSVPLVADMSSNILSQVYDISKFGIIYAGAQKNMGPAGVAVVIIREDLLEEPRQKAPTMMNYQVQAEKNSLYNTPPTYSIYICGLVYKWLKAQGGVAAIEKYNEAKAKILYDFIDESKLFKGTVVPKDRSIMNIPFVTPSDELNAAFIQEAASRGLTNLKGHRSVGGMRASIYNAMPEEGVVALVEFMKEFEAKSHL